MDTVKYDRQIRLFGPEIQEKLSEIKVQVLGNPNLVSAEILKDIVLLGVKKVVTDEKIIEETARIVPDTLKTINPELEIEISTIPVECDFIFMIDTPVKCNTKYCYFLCSKCMTIRKSMDNHVCEATLVSLLEARQCLIGAFAVQEFIKHLQGRDFIDQYQLNFL